MAALAKDRDTPVREGRLINVPVKAGARIHAGSLVVADGGYAAPGRKAENLIALGRAEQAVDNSSGANGDVSVQVRRGLFRWENTAVGAGAVSQAEVGKDVYILDDQTVDKRSAGSSSAGKCVELEGGGVWVETR